MLWLEGLGKYAPEILLVVVIVCMTFFGTKQENKKDQKKLK